MRLIDADALVEWIDIGHLRNPLESVYSERDVVDMLESRPTIDPESLRPKGRWIYKWDAERDPKKLFVRIVCSECNLHTGQKSNYCPNCGTKMEGEE